MTLTSGKLYTGSSDGTLRIWDAKDVSDEMVDDGPPPPVPEGQGGEEAEVVEADIMQGVKFQGQSNETELKAGDFF